MKYISYQEVYAHLRNLHNRWVDKFSGSDKADLKYNKDFDVYIIDDFKVDRDVLELIDNQLLDEHLVTHIRDTVLEYTIKTLRDNHRVFNQYITRQP